MNFIRNIFKKAIERWKITVPAAAVVLAGLAWLAFGFFGIHTAFIDNKVDEAGPVFDTPAVAAEPVAEVDAEPAADEPVADAEATPVDAPDAAAAEAIESDSVTASADDAEAEPADEPVEAPVETTPATTEAPAEPQIVTEASGQFAGTSRYNVNGDALVLGNGTGQRFLRFEGFESSNGPDLNVYLFNPNDRNDFIDLGDLKGNIGDQNYEIPADVDLSIYSEVSIWCVRFSTGFGSATLTTA